MFVRARTALTEDRSAPQTEFAFDGCLLLFGHACCEVGSIEKHAADGGTPHGTSALPRTAVLRQCQPARLHRIVPQPPLTLPDVCSLIYRILRALPRAAQATMADDEGPPLNEWVLVYDSGSGSDGSARLRINIAVLDGAASKQFGKSPSGDLMYKPMVQIGAQKHPLPVLHTSAGGAAGAAADALAAELEGGFEWSDRSMLDAAFPRDEPVAAPLTAEEAVQIMQTKRFAVAARERAGRLAALADAARRDALARAQGHRIEAEALEAQAAAARVAEDHATRAALQHGEAADTLREAAMGQFATYGKGVSSLLVVHDQGVELPADSALRGPGFVLTGANRVRCRPPQAAQRTPLRLGRCVHPIGHFQCHQTRACASMWIWWRP